MKIDTFGPYFNLFKDKNHSRKENTHAFFTVIYIYNGGIPFLVFILCY